MWSDSAWFAMTLQPGMWPQRGAMQGTIARAEQSSSAWPFRRDTRCNIDQLPGVRTTAPGSIPGKYREATRMVPAVRFSFASRVLDGLRTGSRFACRA